MLKKLTKLLNRLSARHDAAGIDDFPEKDYVITNNLAVNLEIVKKMFGNSSDLIVRTFLFGRAHGRAALICFDGLVDADRLSIDVLRPMMHESEDAPPPKTMADVRNSFLVSGEVEEGTTMGEVAKACLNGDSAILVDGIAGVLTVNTKGYPKRSIEDPQTESVIRGPREGFIENMRTNTALLRRKIKDTHFVTEELHIGEKSNTAVTIAYLSNVANPTLITEVKTRLQRIDIDAILSSGYVEQFIADSHSLFFSTVSSSEKPDAVAGKVLEGRVALIVDGSPYVLTMPMLFMESFQTAEDYYIAPVFATMLRFVRFFAFVISILALPLYVALATFHQELIPTELLFTMALAESGTPFPTAIEAFIMVIVFEILKEAGIRLPRPAGQAVSMVGAIIIGETAVTAGFIGAPMVIAVAITAVSAFAVPSQANASALLRLGFLVLAGSMGGFGLTIGILWLLFHLTSMQSFGMPFFSPIAPFRPADTKDTLLRMPLRTMLTRPVGMAKRNPQRQKP